MAIDDFKADGRRGRSQAPSDLMALLIWPLVIIAVIAMVSAFSLGIFNWLHSPPRDAPRRAPVRAVPGSTPFRATMKES